MIQVQQSTDIASHAEPRSGNSSRRWVGCLVKLVTVSLAAWMVAPVCAEDLPLVRVVDLDVSESAVVALSDGQNVKVTLLKLDETRDPVRQAVRSAVVKVRVDDQEVTLESGMYNLPLQVGPVQIDCAVTQGYNSNGTPGFWGLDKAARLRLWPAGSPLQQPGTMIYPVDQRWFATLTWFDNEPIDGGTKILPTIYYHSGLDIGGCEEEVRVIAATDALVVSVGDEVLEGHRQDTPVEPRYDVVYLRDKFGWYYRYSHLYSIHEEIRPGRVIKQGTELGRLGKRGASGGWSHLHFEIKSRQPSGKWGTQAGYAFLWEAYRTQFKPELVANARRKHFLRVGDTTTFDAKHSYNSRPEALQYEWSFTDGTTSKTQQVSRRYDRPGFYSEILKVTDQAGNIDYDFAEVLVLDPARPEEYVPRMHAAFWPTLDNRVDQPFTFKVRSFGTQEGREVWDFGDGSPLVQVKSDGNANPQAADGYAVTKHTYQQPGHYLVKVERSRDDGVTATTRLHVHVKQR